MGVVYQGQDPEIGRVVAIKTLRSITSENFPDKESALKRFRAEAQSAGNLRHPNIVTVFDANIANDIPYIVMDYVEGRTLASILQEHGKLPPGRALHYLRQIALGLDAAHRKGVIHRDIKPTNIVIDPNDQAYILDFGVARMSQSFAPKEGEDNEDEPIMGTPGYMSPEQILNYSLTGKSDLFSFAIVAYECLTGRRPFGGKEFKDMIKSIVQDEPYPLTIAAPELPLALEAEFQRALEKHADARFDTAEIMIDTFKSALGSLLDKRREPTAASPLKRERKPSEWKNIETTSVKSEVLGEAGAPVSEVSSESTQVSEQDKQEGTVEKERSREAHEKLIKVKPKQQGADGDDFTSPRQEFHERPHDGLALPGDMFAYESPMSNRSHDSLLKKRRKETLILRMSFLGLALLLMGSGAYLMFFSTPEPTDVASQKNNVLPDLSATNAATVGDLKKLDTLKVSESKPIEALTDKEILSVISDEETSEVRMLKALKVARERQLAEVVDASVVPLESASYAVRVETIKLLGAMGDKRIVPVLVKRLDDHDPLVRIQTAKVLGNLGSRSAVGYLSTRFFSESNDEVKKELKAAIEKINGFPLVADS